MEPARVVPGSESDQSRIRRVRDGRRRTLCIPHRLPYSPRIVVLYEGDNDIGRGVAPEKVEADFERFVQIVHGGVPQARIVVIGVKPSLLRWAVYDNMKKANALMRAYIETHKGLDYVEVGPPMLGRDGKPRPELFVQDGLHLTPEGYKLWTGLLRPHLD